jgi:hypothetical protein
VSNSERKWAPERIALGLYYTYGLVPYPFTASLGLSYSVKGTLHALEVAQD